MTCDNKNVIAALKTIKRYCEERDECGGCVFYDYGYRCTADDMLHGQPDGWEIPDED